MVPAEKLKVRFHAYKTTGTTNVFFVFKLRVRARSTCALPRPPGDAAGSSIAWEVQEPRIVTGKEGISR